MPSLDKPPSASRSSPGPTAPDPHEIDELRAAMVNAFRVGVFCWPAFFLLDVFVARVVLPGTPLLPFFLTRVVVTALHLLTFRLIPYISRRRHALGLQLLFFGSASAGIGFMALYCGGLDSHYVHGVSIVLLVQAAMNPAPWRRALFALLLDAAPYPLVLVVASFVEPSVRSALHSSEHVATFALDFTFVLGTSIMGAISSHFLWAARRQVYEARKLGRYRLKMRIGAGGMGEVWMAWDETSRRDVALKVLAIEASKRAGAIARFEREARAAAALRSPHTVRVLDYGASDDGVRYLAMELLDGANLGDIVLRAGPLAPARAVHLLRHACASLAEAHGAGIVHRDIKPENLFVTSMNGERDFLKVVDFGIAKVSSTTDDATLTQAGWIGGTPAYMSPEVCAGTEADARSDIYSLGAVLYFLLTGRPPFDAPNAGALMAAHLQEPAPTPSHQAEGVVAALDAITLRCLAKKAEDRFATVGELAAALEGAGVPAWSAEEGKTAGSATWVAGTP